MRWIDQVPKTPGFYWRLRPSAGVDIVSVDADGTIGQDAGEFMKTYAQLKEIENFAGPIPLTASVGSGFNTKT